jgi:hypothetical protein
MRALKLFILLMFLAGSAAAQSTTVTVNVTDAGSQAWANGTVAFTFTKGTGVGAYTWSGGPIVPLTCALNSSGTCSKSVPSSTAITPGDSTWTITVTSNTFPTVSYTVTGTVISGSTQTVNVTPPAISVPVPTTPTIFAPVLAYADNEISGAYITFVYTNISTLNTPQQRICQAVTAGSCSTWANNGSSSGGTGTVTSVGLTVPSWLTVGGTPVTTTGTLAVTPATAQTSAQVIGTCGAATTFGPCSLTLGDLPSGIALLGSSNAFTAGNDFSAATSLLFPKAASATPTIEDSWVWDTTNHRATAGNGTNTSFLPWFTSAPTSGQFAQWNGTLGALTSVASPVASGTQGFLSKYTSGTALGNSGCDEGITTANTFTCSDTAGGSFVKVTLTGPGVGASTFNVGNGTLAGHASGWTIEAPATVSTPSELTGFAAPCSGLWNLTNTSSVVSSACGTAHNISAPLVCAAASGSGTAYTCTTTPSFTPVDGDIVLFQADVASGVAPTLAVNGAAAAAFYKQGGTVAVESGFFGIGSDCLAEYDGAHWQAQCPSVNTAASGSGIPYGAAAGSVNVMTVTTVPAVATNAAGTVVSVLTNLANTTTTPTLNVGGAGAQTILKQGSGSTLIALQANDYLAAAAATNYTFYSNGTNWILTNPQTAQAGTQCYWDTSGFLQSLTTNSCNGGGGVSLGNWTANNWLAGSSVQSPQFSAATVAGNVIFEGGQGSASTGGVTSGNATLTTGPLPGASGANVAGNVIIYPGQVSSAAGTQGILQISTGYFKGTTVTANNLECPLAATSMTVTDCPAYPTNVVGVAIGTVTATPITVQVDGQVLVNSSNTAVVGDTVCAGGTASKVTDNGNNGPCTSGIPFGVVISITTNGASGTLPLVAINKAAGAAPPVQTSILLISYTNSTTSFTNVTGTNNLAFAVNASTNYVMSCHLYYQAAATAGLNIEFTGPASPTSVTYGLTEPVALGTIDNSVATAYSTSLGNTIVTATTNFDAVVSFGLVNGLTAGTVQMLAKSSAAAALTIQPGSFCTMQATLK